MTSPSTSASRWLPAAILAAVTAANFLATPVAEPFKNNDETRIVMTGVFVRDALCDLPGSAADPKGYAVRYYAQYPALGVLIWPPFFFGVEGLAMSVFGTSYLVARLVEWAFFLSAGVYTYRLALRTHGPAVAAVALAVFGFAPLVFDFAAYVLLEVPTVALVVASVFHFERYLGEGRRRDAVLACLVAALAALTRFNGVLLLPYFLIRLGVTGNWGLLARRPVLAGIALALVLTGPYYLFTWREYGHGIRHAAVSGTNKEATGFFDPRNFYLYPSYLPEQVGWAATIAAAAGLAFTLLRERKKAGPELGLLAATYLTAVPFAEPLPRHAIYWVPAVAVFAAVALAEVGRRFGRVAGFVAVTGVVASTAWAGVHWTGWYVRGNQAAAEYVTANASGERPVLIDSDLNGGFIYYLRRADPGRKLWVLRGDKVMYAVMSDPHGRYEEYATTDAEVLASLHRFDPEFVVVEQPQLLFSLPAAERLREVLRTHPERFRLEHTVKYDSNHAVFGRGRLEVYRKLDRNPNPTLGVEVPVLGLGRSLGATR